MWSLNRWWWFWWGISKWMMRSRLSNVLIINYPPDVTVLLDFLLYTIFTKIISCDDDNLSANPMLPLVISPLQILSPCSFLWVSHLWLWFHLQQYQNYRSRLKSKNCVATVWYFTEKCEYVTGISGGSRIFHTERGASPQGVVLTQYLTKIFSKTA